MSTRLRIAASAVAGSFYVMVAASGAVATEISVVSTAGPMPVVMGALIPIFEQASGNKVTIKFQGVPEIFLELKGGASIDLVIANEDTIGDLVEGREIAGGSRVMVSRVGIAAGWRAEAEHRLRRRAQCCADWGEICRLWPGCEWPAFCLGDFAPQTRLRVEVQVHHRPG
jgi:ABC-type molybdate transport system substrate-binding protein